MSNVIESLIFGQKTSDSLGNQMSEFPALIPSCRYIHTELPFLELVNSLVSLYNCTLLPFGTHEFPRIAIIILCCLLELMYSLVLL